LATLLNLFKFMINTVTYFDICSLGRRRLYNINSSKQKNMAFVNKSTCWPSNSCQSFGRLTCKKHRLRSFQTISQNVSTTSWLQLQCMLSAVQGSGVPGRLLYISLRHSQPTSFKVSHSTSPNRTTLPAQHFRSSGLLCRWSDGLELANGQSPWPGAHQQQLQTIAENEPISSLPAHAAQ